MNRRIVAMAAVFVAFQYVFAVTAGFPVSWFQNAFAKANPDKKKHAVN